MAVADTPLSQEPTRTPNSSRRHSGHKARRPGAHPPPLHPNAGLLPQPPDDREKYAYSRRNQWVLTVFTLIAIGSLTVSQLNFSQSSLWFWLFAPYFAAVITATVISVWLDGFTGDFDLAAHRRRTRTWRPKAYPSVDVFLPVCGEPIEVLHNTWTHVRNLAQVYPGVVTAYVLDDSDLPEFKEMARDFGFQYRVRPERGWYKKAGNLQYGFGISSGDFILILDADFAPRADLLQEMMPYMDDADVGIIQSPQFFRVLDSQNWIERGAGAVQEHFYRAIQVSRDGQGTSICCGSCALYRRAALADNGGTTLIEHSEDMHTGFDVRGHGWVLRYIPVALSTGVCPDTIGAYFNQQYRWAWGTLSLVTHQKFWDAQLGVRARLAYVGSFMYYLTSATGMIFVPLIPVSLLLFAPGEVLAEASLLLLPAVFYATVIQPLWHRAPYRLEAWAAQIIQGWSHVCALLDLVRGRHMGWKPSGSSGVKSNGTRRLWRGMYGWSCLGSALWVGLALWRMLDLYPPDFALVLALGLLYAASVGRALIQPHTLAKA
ncbi:glycosyltransferase family 2 protein [Streptomyces sp. T-3]|nr:glycosyltransferase family 2 protein [Streptomyces sp. T-3]